MTCTSRSTPSSNGEVAIKALPDAFKSDEARLRLFRREAEAAAKLKHPNIATIHALEDLDDVTFIVMEYGEGEPLSDHHRAELVSGVCRIEMTQEHTGNQEDL